MQKAMRHNITILAWFLAVLAIIVVSVIWITRFSNETQAAPGETDGEAIIRSMEAVPIAPIEDTTLKEVVPEKNPKFQIFQGKDEKYYFRLIAANGQPIGRSEGYNGKPACKNGIQSVVNNADSEVVKATEKE